MGAIDDKAASQDSNSSARRTAVVSKTEGERVADRYELETEIGRGGFGVVFLATDTRLSKRVAVKVLSASVTEGSVSLARFKQEATAAARIGHKGIVDVTDAGEDEDGAHFIVMEYIEGSDLGYVIRCERPLPLARSLAIGARIAQALVAAHGKGIIHRDLKPGNILLTSMGPVSDFVKILDFGVSKINVLADAADGLTQDGHVVGTPRYMAPEQGLGDAIIDARIDIYALGCMLYEMVTGQLPFTGSSHYEIIHNKLSMDALPPSVVNPDIEFPLEFEALVLKALAREPDQRYESMSEFELALRDLLEKVDPAAASGVRPAAPTPQPGRADADANASASLSTRLVRHPTRPGRAPTPSATAVRARATKQAAEKRRKVGLAALVGGGVVLVALAILLLPRWLGSASEAERPTPGAVAPAAQPEAQPAAADQAEMVEIRFALQPPGARVEIDGVVASENPVRLPRSNDTHQVVVSAPGHESAQRTFQALVSGELEVELEPSPPEPAPRRPRPRKPDPRLPDSPL